MALNRLPMSNAKATFRGERTLADGTTRRVVESDVRIVWYPTATQARTDANASRYQYTVHWHPSDTFTQAGGSPFDNNDMVSIPALNDGTESALQSVARMDSPFGPKLMTGYINPVSE